MSKENISILIVDDEPEARDLLTILLERVEGVKIAGDADSVDNKSGTCRLESETVMELKVARNRLGKLEAALKRNL